MNARKQTRRSQQLFWNLSHACLSILLVLQLTSNNTTAFWLRLVLPLSARNITLSTSQTLLVHMTPVDSPAAYVDTQTIISAQTYTGNRHVDSDTGEVLVVQAACNDAGQCAVMLPEQSVFSAKIYCDPKYSVYCRRRLRVRRRALLTKNSFNNQLVLIGRLGSVNRNAVVATGKNCGVKTSGPSADVAPFVARFADAISRGALQHRSRALDARVVCDDAFVRLHDNNVERALRRLNLALALVRQILQCQLNVQLIVRAIRVQREGVFAATTLHSERNQSLDSAFLVLRRYAQAMRGSFRIGRSASTSVDDTDVIHFVTGRILADNVRGLSDVEGACDPRHALSLSSDAGADSPAEIAVVMLHEIGHSLGMHHRAEDCNCIMGPQLRESVPRGFDVISRAESEVFFRFGGQCVAAQIDVSNNASGRCSSESQDKVLNFGREAASDEVAPDIGLIFPPRVSQVNNTNNNINARGCSSVFHLRACRSQTECNSRCPSWRCVPVKRAPGGNSNNSNGPTTVVVGSCQPALLTAPCIVGGRRTIAGNLPLSVITDESAAGNDCGSPLVCCNVTDGSRRIRPAAGVRPSNIITGTCLFRDSPTCKAN